MANIPGVYIVLERFKYGDEVKDVSNLFSIAFQFVIVSNNVKELANKLKLINNKLVQKDINGNNMLLPYESYTTLINSLKLNVTN